MKPVTKHLRRVLKAAIRAADVTERPVLEWYVCGRPDNTAWVSPKCDSDRIKLKAILERAGYRCECNGKPETSGQWIIDVLEVLP